MKVYFGTSPRNKDKYPDLISKIFELIGEFGLEHTSDWVKNVVAKNFYEMTEKESADHYKKTEKEIKAADICIFEASSASASLGFLASQAMNLGKPIIVLSQNQDSLFIFKSIKSKQMITLVYNQQNLETKLKEAIDKAAFSINLRFNLFIPRNLMAYLDWVTKNVGVNKSEYIRMLIEKEVKKKK
jgi:hypothetical protein